MVLALVLVAACASCGEAETPSDRSEAETSQRVAVERCIDRLITGADREALGDLDEDAVRRYLEETYCDRFAREGWVYADGALSIDAHTWLERSYGEDCGEAASGEPAVTVPCDEAPGQDLDCAFLRHVRRAEVEAYLARLPEGTACNDGTSFDELGVP